MGFSVDGCGQPRLADVSLDICIRLLYSFLCLNALVTMSPFVRSLIRNTSARLRIYTCILPHVRMFVGPSGTILAGFGRRTSLTNRAMLKDHWWLRSRLTEPPSSREAFGDQKANVASVPPKHSGLLSAAEGRRWRTSDLMTEKISGLLSKSR